MSEYQYYEFQAIDRPLTSEEMRELRSFSTRARITPTSFVNEYAWGNFKGDEDAWMEKYFDAFLYLANWGTRVFKLRLPAGLLDLETAQEYCGGESASDREKNGKVIVSFTSDDEGGGEWVEGEGRLASLLSVRSDLARGDLRALYLVWLLRADIGELDEEEVEPPVPPGLGQLSGALESLAEFLRIDENLVAAAAEASAPVEESRPKTDEVRAWVAKLPADEKDRILANLVVDAGPTQVAELLRRFLQERKRTGARPGAPPGRRTAGQLLRAAEARTAERHVMEVKRRAEETARKEREAAIARAKHLDGIAGRERELWAEVESLVAAKQAKSYEQAVKLLVDLRDLDSRKKGGDFRLRLDALRQAHERKPAFIERLQKAGLG